jgi:hypothetical protein
LKYGVGLLVMVGAVFGASTPVLSAPASGASNGLSFGASGEVLYDSNQLRANPAGGGHADDFRYSPLGSARYEHLLGRGTIVLNGLVGYDFYQYNSTLNRNRFAAGGVLTARAGSSCSAVVNGNYSSRQNGTSSFGTSAPVAPSTADLPPEDIGRLIDNRQIFVTYGLNANCGAPGGRLSFGGAAVHSSLDNGSSLRSFANSNSTVYSLFAGLGVFRPGQLQINGSYSTIDYPNHLIVPGAPISPAGLNTGVKTYSVGLTYSRPIGNKLTGSIGLSYLTSRPSGGQAPYSAPAYNVSLSYHPGPRLNFSAAGSRSVLSSTGAGALFRVVDAVQLSASYEIGRSLTAHANAGLTANNYQLPFAIPGQPARRTDSTKIVGIGVNYRPRPLYDVGIYASKNFRTSDTSLFNYNSTRASITLSVHV